MRLLEHLSVAMSEIARNRLRTFLTTLGVMIGVASVIALVSLGKGANVRVTSQVSGLGANLITVLPLPGTSLDLDDAAALRSRAAAVARVVPAITLASTVKLGSRTYATTVEGVTEDLAAVRGYRVAVGRFLAAGDVEARRRVAVVGQEVVRQLGGVTVGDTLVIAGQPFAVVGILAPKGATFGRNQDDTVFVPVSTASRLAGTVNLNALYLSASSGEEAGLAAAHVTAILRSRHPRADGSDPVRVLSQDQLLSAVSEVSRTMTLFLGAVAGISLVVGGIGIMNIMLVSVAERTREIGIRMAVGARSGDVLLQFLVESVLLSLLGGLAGVAVGTAAAGWLARLLDAQAVGSPEAVVAALAFAGAVGLFFGAYPAWRASRLDPVLALRHE